MKFKQSIIIIPVILFFMGCTAVPKDIMKPATDAMAIKQMQSRRYDTTDDEKIMIAVVGLMQDTGFILDKSNSDLGFVSVKKTADADNGGQIAGALALDVLSLMAGGRSDNLSNVDDTQKVNASVIIKPTADSNGVIVRLTYQRIVWNKKGELSRVETLKDEEMYRLFFDKLSKSIFLEENQI